MLEWATGSDVLEYSGDTVLNYSVRQKSIP